MERIRMRLTTFRLSLLSPVVLAGGLLLAVSLLSSRALGEDWPKYNRDLGNTARSAETGITSKNVKSLKSKWTFQTKSKVSAAPSVATINGTSTVFIGAWNGVFYALDAVTGKQIWSFKVDMVGLCSQTKGCRIGSSAAVDTSQNLVFFGSQNAYLYALNATTGKLVWKQSVGDSNAGYEVWSSPSFYNGNVFTGAASHDDDPCIEGGLVNSYNELTGKLNWSFNTLDQTTCPNGEDCVGGSVWASVAIDDVNGIVYAGTGNPGAACIPPTKNADLYPDSVVALRASDGTLLNYFKAIQNDEHDKDFGSSPVLHTSGENNQCTGTNTAQYWVTEGSKNGHIFTLERDANGLTGNIEDNFPSAGGFVGTPAVRPVRKTSSCGSGKKIIDQENSIYAPGATGAFWTYYQDGTGKTTLQSKVKPNNQPLFGAAASIQDVVLYGSKDGNLYAAGKKGKTLTKFSIGEPVVGGPSVSNGRVYFGTMNGTIHCMSIDGN